MNRKLLVQVTAPAVIIGLLLFAVCLTGVWFTVRSQRNLTDVLSQEVASMQAAQELEIRVRQLRFRDFLNLIDAAHARTAPPEEAHRNFEKALEQARQAAPNPRAKEAVEAIAQGYRKYQQELALLRHELPAAGARANLHELVDAHPIRYVVDPCEELIRISKEQIHETMLASDELGQTLRWVLIGVGALGPCSGLLAGFGIARGLSRSIYQLSVRVQDMARHLDQQVASVTLPADGDIEHLDRQLQHVVRRVGEAAEKLQQHQREMLRAEQMSAVGQLAASVAHEVRNPLTSIKILVEAALRPRQHKPLSEEDLEVIYREVVRLEKTVQNLLDFARPTAPQRSSCDLCDLVSRAMDLVGARARQQHVDLDFDRPAEAIRVNADAGQLTSVLVNLLLNAMDAMPTGGRLEIALTPSASSTIALTVADTGAGIAPGMIDRLFTPFVSGKPTGTGLGLSISKRIVEEHGGTIGALNRPEGGACFTVVLPSLSPALLGCEAVHADTAGH
jgi:two-component system sensor histidine kinase HydH